VANCLTNIGLISEGSKNDEPTDWGEVFTTLLTHTSMGSCEIIAEHTILQINKILERLPKHLEIKMGIPGLFGGGGSVESKPVNPGRAPKLSEIMNFCGGF